MTTYIAQVHTRARSHGRYGPDTYVAVTVAPVGVVVPANLNANTLARRGIDVTHFGTGYKKATGPRSQLGKALAEARAYAAEVNRNPEGYLARKVAERLLNG